MTREKPYDPFFKSVSHAKRVCREMRGHLPRCGWEILLRKGEFRGGYSFETWLQNRGGRYVVDTHRDVSYVRIGDRIPDWQLNEEATHTVLPII